MHPDAERTLVDLRGTQAQQVRKADCDTGLGAFPGRKLFEGKDCLIQGGRRFPEIDPFVHADSPAGAMAAGLTRDEAGWFRTGRRG